MSSELHSLPISSHPKVVAMELTLQDTIKCFKDLVDEYEKLHKENMDYKLKFQSQEEKCSCNLLSSNDSLKKELEQKNYLIQEIASALTKLLETKDFRIIGEILKIICSNESKAVVNEIPDESMSEIEVTPGRKSPIIVLSKKLRGNTNSSFSVNKKSEESRATPEKCVKLIFPSPSRGKGGGRLKQSRLNILKEKPSLVVDLTCSPEAVKCIDDKELKCDIKKEVLDCDETILPSPTSGPVFLPKVFKSKDSPSKFKKPQSPLKLKMETQVCQDGNQNNSVTYTQHSIDLMKHCRLNIKLSKSENQDENIECDANESLSLLQQNKNNSQKAPLGENNNLLNKQVDMESSLSILQRNVRVSPPQPTLPKRTKLEPVEPVYKEPTLRKKSEKRALPGWSCDECKQFYGALYADNPEMLAQKMDECSKHRGRNNPIRPSTPDGFWEIRWDVPTDTEEFNRRNNAM